MRINAARNKRLRVCEVTEIKRYKSTLKLKIELKLEIVQLCLRVHLWRLGAIKVQDLIRLYLVSALSVWCDQTRPVLCGMVMDSQ